MEPKGFDFGLVAGYRHRFENRFFLGLEGDAVWSNADDDVDVLGTTLKAEKNHSFGLAIKPGFGVTEQLDLFGVLGYRWSEYELSGLGFTDDDRFHGYVLGAGAEWNLSDRVSISAEYNHVALNDQIYDLGGGATLRYEGNENLVKTAVKFHF